MGRPSRYDNSPALLVAAVLVEVRMDKKPTKRMLQFLQWMAFQQKPVGLFPVEWGAIRRRALKEGYTEECGKESGQGFFAFSLYRLTDKARAALAGEG